MDNDTEGSLTLDTSSEFTFTFTSKAYEKKKMHTQQIRLIKLDINKELKNTVTFEKILLLILYQKHNTN